MPCVSLGAVKAYQARKLAELKAALNADDIDVEPRSRRASFAATRIIAGNRAEIAEEVAAKNRPTVILPTTLNGYFTPSITKLHPVTKLKSFTKQLSRRYRRRPTLTDLINAESKLGGAIFGPIPEGHRREFFHDRDNVWIWHEGWIDETSHPQHFTVRYEVRPTGVFKKVAAGKYFELSGHELENFRLAVHVYLQTIKLNLYHRV